MISFHLNPGVSRFIFELELSTQFARVRHRRSMDRYSSKVSIQEKSRIEVNGGLFLAVFCTMCCLPCSLLPHNLHPHHASLDR
ncbi:hypothetical protein NA56DRAFT_186618 [Hyaloscypha hepaticicola]|uniref:Uncharacterized protein n=1 Tax=Hyaloscypha hepaticicola TaxID=2082293 RepID=A0A2J6Q1L7_9HELO|nr:hypothetical protein NA56DRAFT_186618 [Hyaloscypha hepaticicola]